MVKKSKVSLTKNGGSYGDQSDTIWPAGWSREDYCNTLDRHIPWCVHILRLRNRFSSWFRKFWMHCHRLSRWKFFVWRMRSISDSAPASIVACTTWFRRIACICRDRREISSYYANPVTGRWEFLGQRKWVTPIVGKEVENSRFSTSGSFSNLKKIQSNTHRLNHPGATRL